MRTERCSHTYKHGGSCSDFRPVTLEKLDDWDMIKVQHASKVLNLNHNTDTHQTLNTGNSHCKEYVHTVAVIKLTLKKNQWNILTFGCLCLTVCILPGTWWDHWWTLRSASSCHHGGGSETWLWSAAIPPQEHKLALHTYTPTFIQQNQYIYKTKWQLAPVIMCVCLSVHFLLYLDNLWVRIHQV